jgi:hypothetical protein
VITFNVSARISNLPSPVNDNFIPAVDVSGFSSRSVPPRDGAEFGHDESGSASGQDAGTSSSNPESENGLSVSFSDEENSDDPLEPNYIPYPLRVPVEDDEPTAEDPGIDTTSGADDESLNPSHEEPDSPTTEDSDIDAASRTDDDLLDPDYIPYPLRVPADLDGDTGSDVAPETNEKKSGSRHDPDDIPRPRPRTTAKRRKRPFNPSFSPEGDADQSEVESGLVSKFKSRLTTYVLIFSQSAAVKNLADSPAVSVPIVHLPRISVLS